MDYPEPDNDLTLPVAWRRDLRSVCQVWRWRDGGDDGVGGPLAEVGILAQVIEAARCGQLALPILERECKDSGCLAQGFVERVRHGNYTRHIREGHAVAARFFLMDQSNVVAHDLNPFPNALERRSLARFQPECPSLDASRSILLETADDIATVLEHQSAQKYACNGLTSKLPAFSAAMASATASAPDMVV